MFGPGKDVSPLVAMLIAFGFAIAVAVFFFHPRLQKGWRWRGGVAPSVLTGVLLILYALTFGGLAMLDWLGYTSFVRRIAPPLVFGGFALCFLSFVYDELRSHWRRRK